MDSVILYNLRTELFERPWGVELTCVRGSLLSWKVLVLWLFRDPAFTLVHGTSSLRVADHQTPNT